MIRIQEIMPAAKVSGISSFLVSFSYREDIVQAMKTLPNYYYHKKDKLWEVPANCLAALLDTLTFLDDIQISFAEIGEISPVAVQPVLSQPEIEAFKFKPFKHQIDAINFGLTQKDKWLLLDSMGLGKTLEVIGLAETLKRRGLIEHCFIVCGVNALKQNWKKEIAKFSTESCIVLGEKISKKGRISYASVADRAAQLKAPIEEFFIITNVETLRDDRIIDAFKTSENNFDMIAVDEAHRLATKSSQQGANLLKLKAKYKIAATGTLITNNPISCYVPLAWTENDHATLTMYKSQYCNFGGFNNSQVIGYKNLDLLKDELDSCSLRRTLDQVRDMPPKTITYELIEMDDKHKKFYEAIKDGVKEEADKIELKSSNLLALTTRLRQASSCPSVLTTQQIPASKVDRCVELVEDLAEQGEKVVILSIFKETVDVLARALSKYNPMINTGDTPDQQVSENVDKFQNEPGFQIFIGTWAKVATGLTLNAAQYLICMDTPYTYAMFSQGTDRIWRVNNTRPAFITVLACKETIDERVMDIVEHKKELSDFIIDNVNNELAASIQDELRDIIRGL